MQKQLQWLQKKKTRGLDAKLKPQESCMPASKKPPSWTTISCTSRARIPMKSSMLERGHRSVKCNPFLRKANSNHVGVTNLPVL